MLRDGKQVLSDANGVTDIAVASTGSAYSAPFLMSNADKIGWEFIATSDAAVDVVAELYVSNDGTNYKEQDSYADIINLTDEVRHFGTIVRANIPAAKWGKIKFTGQGSNAASTTVAGKLNIVRDE